MADAQVPADLAARVSVAPERPQQARLAQSVRRLLEAVVVTDVPGDDLDAVADEIDAASGRLEARQRERGRPMRTSDGRLALHTNPVLGEANPYAPPVRVELIDGVLRGQAVCTDTHEGPPGCVHGGVSSLMLDQTLGLANLLAGHPGVTIGLDVRYRRPTPLHTELEVSAWHDRVEGDTVYCAGEIRADGRLCVEATGIFRALRSERTRAAFASR